MSIFPLNRTITLLSSISSTNDFLKEIRNENSNSSIAVISDHQSMGKGQANNRWESKSCQNVLLSVLYPCKFSSDIIPSTSVLVSLILRRLVEQELEREVMVKWPNDILVGRKKVAGILCQGNIMGNSLSSLLIGIGLNVNQVKFETPNAVSLANVDGIEREILPLALKILKLLDEQFLQAELPSFESIQAEYHKYLFGFGEAQNYLLRGEEIKANNLGIDSFGRLKLEIAGEISLFQPKEVELVRT